MLREEFLRTNFGPTEVFSIQYGLAYSGTVEFKESTVRTLSWVNANPYRSHAPRTTPDIRITLAIPVDSTIVSTVDKLDSQERTWIRVNISRVSLHYEV